MVAFPPRDAPYLSGAKVPQLAADLGMPSGTTGQDIIASVIHGAIAKNELDKVTPLIRAPAGAARILEGRIVVPSEVQLLVIKLYPGVARALGFMERAEEAGLSRHYDDVSRHVCPSDSSSARELNAHGTHCISDRTCVRRGAIANPLPEQPRRSQAGRRSGRGRARTQAPKVRRGGPPPTRA